MCGADPLKGSGSAPRSLPSCRLAGSGLAAAREVQKPGFRPCKNASFKRDLCAQLVNAASALDQPRPDLQLLHAGHGAGEADVQVAGYSLNAVVEEAMGHRRIQDGGYNASVQDPVISLQPGVRPERGQSGPILSFMEPQSQGPGILPPA